MVADVSRPDVEGTTPAGAGVTGAVEVGDGAVVVVVLATGAGAAGGSGGGVKMPSLCLFSRSFSSLAALAAALSC